MSGFGVLRKIKASFGESFVFSKSLFRHIVVPKRTSIHQPSTCDVVDFFNTRPHLGYETETLIRDMVCSESDEESMRNLNDVSISPCAYFMKVQVTNSFKYNEGNVIDICFKCFVKQYRTFHLVFG